MPRQYGLWGALPILLPALREEFHDTWTHAREAITGEMREAMRTDDRGNSGYVNPVYLMADSGARGGIEQIRLRLKCWSVASKGRP